LDQEKENMYIIFWTVVSLFKKNIALVFITISTPINISIKLRAHKPSSSSPLPFSSPSSLYPFRLVVFCCCRLLSIISTSFSTGASPVAIKWKNLSFSFSIFLRSACCVVLYFRQVTSSVTLTMSLPSQCRYLTTYLARRGLAR